MPIRSANQPIEEVLRTSAQRALSNDRKIDVTEANEIREKAYAAALDSGTTAPQIESTIQNFFSGFHRSQFERSGGKRADLLLGVQVFEECMVPIGTPLDEVFAKRLPQVQGHPSLEALDRLATSPAWTPVETSVSPVLPSVGRWVIDEGKGVVYLKEVSFEGVVTKVMPLWVLDALLNPADAPAKPKQLRAEFHRLQKLKVVQSFELLPWQTNSAEATIKETEYLNAPEAPSNGTESSPAPRYFDGPNGLGKMIEGTLSYPDGAQMAALLKAATAKQATIEKTPAESLAFQTTLAYTLKNGKPLPRQPDDSMQYYLIVDVGLALCSLVEVPVGVEPAPEFVQAYNFNPLLARELLTTE